MDSLTQIVLGAAVGELMLAKKIGNRGQLLGAIAGTIPDLDVFFTSSVSDDLLYLQIHRGYSHAAFTHVLLAFPLAYLTFQVFKRKISYLKWYLFWFTGLITHAMLDCCTTFGTQFLLPFSNYLVGLNNISVVDPLYTIPFLVLLSVCLFHKRNSERRAGFAKAALAYSLIYMAFTFIVKLRVHQEFAASLHQHGRNPEAVYTTPAILTSFLWSGIAVSGDSLFIGDYSIMQKEKGVNWIGYAMNRHLLDHPAKKDLDVLLWFSQGKFILRQEGDTLEFYNVKWGRSDFRYSDPEKAFIFHFKIFPFNGGWTTKGIEPSFDGRMKDAFLLLWRRIFHKSVA